MSAPPEVPTLVAYTDWLRARWEEHLRAGPPELLATQVGPHGDGRFQTVGETVRHIFGAEARYVDRVRGRDARDVSQVATDTVDALFALAAEARADLRALLQEMPPEGWEGEAVHPIGAFEFEGTPRKIVVHALIHEIRHWAQIGTTLRLGGHGPPLHDLLVSPVLGGEFRRRPEPDAP